MTYAEQFGYRIKHLGVTRRTDKGDRTAGAPTLIPERRLIANVDGVMNAVLVKGDAVGPTLYYGAGAGSLPTASAVVADIIDVTRTLPPTRRTGCRIWLFNPASCRIWRLPRWMMSRPLLSAHDRGRQARRGGRGGGHSGRCWHQYRGNAAEAATGGRPRCRW